MRTNFLKQQKTDILNKIIKKMDDKDMSKIDLSKELKTTKAYVTALLNGKSFASLEKLIEIANKLDIKVEIRY